MSFDPDRVSAVSFDSYSTVVDVDAAAEAFPDRVEDPAAVADTWRERKLTYATMATLMDTYEDFWAMVQYGLDYALSVHDVDLDADEREAALSVYHDLPAFEDVRPGMERLVDMGYDLYVVSNGNPEMLESMLDSADVRDLVSDTISCDEIETYKVDPTVYWNAAARMGTPAREVAHATRGWFDAIGAKNVGMQGVWVNRFDEHPETWGPDPDLEVSTFHGIADALEDAA